MQTEAKEAVERGCCTMNSTELNFSEIESININPIIKIAEIEPIVNHPDKSEARDQEIIILPTYYTNTNDTNSMEIDIYDLVNEIERF